MAGPWERYATPTDGPWTKYSDSTANWTPPVQEQPKAKTIGDYAGEALRNLAGGALRGAGSIGATLATPYDLIAGNTNSIANPERRALLDPAIAEFVGSDPNSLVYKGGKLGGEIAGTAGMGGAIANGVTKLSPAVAERLPALLEAIRTSGMTTGTPGANLLTRSIGGAIPGAAQAALVNPQDAATGAVIGAVAPGVIQATGKVGQAIGQTFKGPEQTPETIAAIQAAREAGYVIPPTQANPSLRNRMLEGYAGKISTAQNASAKNQAVTNSKAAQAIGLPKDTTLTPEVLDSVRAQAGKAYAEVAALPPRPAVAPDQLRNIPGSPAIDPKAMVFDLRKARNDATAWYRSYGRTADPDALVKAQTAAAKAKELDAALEQYATSVGRPDLVPAMRDARTLIAKTYSIEDALNTATGTVDAKKLARQLEKGKPLSGDLKDAAQFAGRFPKAAQPVESMGSLPQFSPLDVFAGGGLTVATGNPLAMATVLGRPLARSAALSGPVQNGLVQQPGSRLAELLANPASQQMIYRSAPLIGADR